MDRMIMIGDKPYKIRASAGVLVHYKSEFGTDYIEDSRRLAEDDNAEAEQYAIVGTQFLWAMVRTADMNILPYTEWAVSLGEFDLESALSVAQELFTQSLSSISEHSESNNTEPLTAEKLIAYSALCGMTLADLDKLPLSMVLKTIRHYVHIKYGGQEEREAVQEDYDNF